MTNLLFVSYSSKISSSRSALSPTSKLCFEQPVSANLKMFFEQPKASFLVCSLIFIEYQI
ncbi:S1 RNA-binding domain-containing protein [Streptococcus pneumoniae]|nr:S1 RNA-binding domain-containing protein [Streptococcus pneumoniae]